MRGIFVDDERSAHINFQYELQNRDEIKKMDYFLDPQDAVAYAQTTPIDCAFLDIHLPGIQGIDLAKALKSM